jgi:hypothetical protein
VVDIKNPPISSSHLSAWMYNFAIPYRTPAIAQIYGVSGLFTSTRCSRASIFMAIQTADAVVIPAPAHKKEKRHMCKPKSSERSQLAVYQRSYANQLITKVKVKN